MHRDDCAFDGDAGLLSMNEPGLAVDPYDHEIFRLPCDFYPMASHPRWESYAFELPLPTEGAFECDGVAAAALPGVLAGAALCVLFARLTGHGAIPLRVAGASQAERSRPTSLRVLAAPACPAADIVAQIAESLEARRDTDPGGPAPPSGADADAVELVFVESQVGSDLANAALDLHGADAPLRLLLPCDGARSGAAVVYDARRFTATTIERFAGHLGVLVAAIAAAPNTSLSALPLLTPAERHALDAVCEGGLAAPTGESVVRRIERQAARAGGAIAVRYGGRSLTYAELDARANQVAALLEARGIGAEKCVVVCVEPGFEIAVALLGILKAGAVYVPVDPAHPRAYRQAILDDVRPALILTQQRLLTALEPHEAEKLPLDGLGVEPDREPFGGAPADRAVSPEQTAYVFYTSGTTGKPKGVMASHANLEAYVSSVRERYSLTSADVVPALARYTFSISLFELLPVLTVGGTLDVLDRDAVLDPARLAEALEAVTLFHAGPSLLRLLVEHVQKHSRDLHAFRGVRHASSGGDMVPADLLESMKTVFPYAEVFVIYGCSEVSCMGCTYPVPRERQVTRTYVGRPFAGTSVRILDAQHARLPAGAVGEICFAGAGVVKGYLNRPELAPEKFIEIEGRRFYRTGDLGRITDDGWLEILGRSDFQAKVRGMRVELAEVEHHLRRAPGVKNGVVTTKEMPDGEKVLVAYVVFEADHGSAEGAVTAATIRRHMMEHLPEHMVPAMYLELRELPLNHNMKIDRRALPAPDVALRAADGARRTRQPETPTEMALAAIFARLLDVSDIGLDDNFFELGGHSLLAVRLIAEVSTELGVALEGMAVLRETLEVLARSCDERLGRARTAPAPRRDCSSTVPRVESFHFGRDRALYGVLHHPVPSSCEEAVVVCAPIGHECLRAQFVLHQLARRLGRLGFPVLRFDYFGTGNSLGEGAGADGERWCEDVADAVAELERRTGRARTVLVGARLGATLAWTLSDGLDVARWVFWDPVCSGAKYVATMQAMHRRHLRATEPFNPRALLRRARSPRGTTELLGTTYSHATLRHLERLSMAPRVAAPPRPVAWLASAPDDAARAAVERLRAAGLPCRFETLATATPWEDGSCLEDLLPDAGATRVLAAMVTEVP